MTAQWHGEQASRPDRYQDWANLFDPGDGTRFCPVVVRLRGEGRDALLSSALRVLGDLARTLFNREAAAIEKTGISLGPFSLDADELRALFDEAARVVEQKGVASGVPVFASDDSLAKMVFHILELAESDEETAAHLLEEYPRLHFFYIGENNVHDETVTDNEAFEVLYVGPPVETLSGECGQFVTTDAKASRESAFTGKPEVALGVIDDGFAFANDALRNRLSGLWVQERETFRPAGLGIEFGYRLDADALFEMTVGRHEQETYRTSLPPSPGLSANAQTRLPLDFSSARHQPLAYAASHGTHVLGTFLSAFDSAGNAGAMMDPVFAVQLPTEVTANTSGSTLASYFLAGLWHIMTLADRAGIDDDDLPAPLPLVVNFSYGFAAGPKDGTHPIEQLIDLFATARRDYFSARLGKPIDTVVVLPAGNGHEARHTAVVKLSTDELRAIDWVVRPDDRTSSFLEIWLGREDEDTSGVTVRLVPPAGFADLIEVTGDGTERQVLRTATGGAVAALYDDSSAHWPLPLDPPTWKRRVFMALAPTISLEGDHPVVPAGTWRIELEHACDAPVEVHMHVQRDDTPTTYPVRGRQSILSDPKAREWDHDRAEFSRHAGPVTHEATLSAITGGQSVRVVGALSYAATDETTGNLSARASDYSASGPTPARGGPDHSAIADRSRIRYGISGPATYSGTGLLLSGTSVAAPQIAGRIAADFKFLRPLGVPQPLDARKGAIPPDLLLRLD